MPATQPNANKGKRGLPLGNAAVYQDLLEKLVSALSIEPFDGMVVKVVVEKAGDQKLRRATGHEPSEHPGNIGGIPVEPHAYSQVYLVLRADEAYIAR